MLRVSTWQSVNHVLTISIYITFTVGALAALSPQRQWVHVASSPVPVALSVSLSLRGLRIANCIYYVCMHSQYQAWNWLHISVTNEILRIRLFRRPTMPPSGRTRRQKKNEHSDSKSFIFELEAWSAKNNRRWVRVRALFNRLSFDLALQHCLLWLFCWLAGCQSRCHTSESHIKWVQNKRWYVCVQMLSSV